ncbi:PPE family protein [Mycobacterium conspicuum]|uniref:PPE family protein n=1 Tax=Mycobacterium conspicuum TaxID=44010 RepID=UPI000A162044|nr:PPE family protein [Mycobacterium conspicuum]
MVLDFARLPPEINSARIFAGAGSGPLHVAATAWDGLAQDLSASASSFDSVIVGLTSGPWAGPASASMAAAAAPYVAWLTAAAGKAALAAAQARAAAAAFETALAATVHPAAVTANRTTLATLIATNFFGLNAPAIAATEFTYVEMWAADVAAMLGYHSTSASVASTLAQFDVPPLSLAGLTGWVSSLESQATAALSSLGSSVGSSVTSTLTNVASVVSSAVSNPSAALSAVESAASGLSPLTSVAQIAMYPASMAISPLMSIAQMANSSGAATAGLAGANAAALAGDATKFVGNAVPDLKPFGGAGGLGAGMGADLGKARLVGAMSVPPTWQGSMPARMVSSAMSGMGAMPNAAAAMAGAAQGAGGMTPMPMPMGMGGAGAGMPGGMMGRGGASPHVVQNRPSVVPRTGV